MQFKSLKQMNAERALKPARPMTLKKLVKKINKENAPPDGWKPEDKVASAQTKNET
jgi:hypothetical protein